MKLLTETFKRNFGQVYFDGCGYVIMVNKPNATAWLAKCTKTGNCVPKYHKFTTPAQMWDAVALWRARIEANFAKKEKDKAQRRKARAEYQPKAKISDIFIHSWGYEASFYDFYQVVALKGRRATLQPLTKVRDLSERPSGYNSYGYVKPGDADKDKKPIVKMLSDGGFGDTFNMPFGVVEPWNGRSYEEYNNH